jgi:hypothetical protein
MNNVLTPETYEQLTNKQVHADHLQVTTERKLPAIPFPRKYVLSVFVDLQDAMQAAQALRDAGFDEQGIHVLLGREFAEAVTQDQSPFHIVTSIDYDIYQREASRGRSFLAVRPASYAQLKEIRDLLAPHGAYLATYIDNLTLTELLP